MANVSFKYGLKEAYNQLNPPVEGVLYFITDTHEIYRGSELVAVNNISRVDSLPEIGEALPDVFYITNTGGRYEINLLSSDSQSWTKIYSGPADAITADAEQTLTNKTIDADSNTITNLETENFKEDAISTSIPASDAVDTKLVTEKAVADAVSAIQEEMNGKYDSVTGAFKGVRIGEPSDPELATEKFGLIFTPVEGAEITIDLDKEKFLQSAQLEEDGQTLSLTLTDGTEVEIDLAAIVATADTVKTTSDVTLTTAWGLLKPGDKINANTSIQQLLIQALSKDINPSAINPTATISLSGAGAKEVGTEFTPSFTVNYTDGKYRLVVNGSNQDTNANCEVTTYHVSDTDSHTSDQRTGNFDVFTVTEDTNYKVSVTVDYAQGDMPKTYLGSDYASVQIPAGTTSSSSSAAVTGYRSYFYGYKNALGIIADPTAITSAEVRALTAARSFPSSITTNQMQQMFFACPAGTYASVTVQNATNGAPQTVKKAENIMVEGANGYTAAAYDVFYVSNATAESGETKFNLSFNK